MLKNVEKRSTKVNMRLCRFQNFARGDPQPIPSGVMARPDGPCSTPTVAVTVFVAVSSVDGFGDEVSVAALLVANTT